MAPSTLITDQNPPIYLKKEKRREQLGWLYKIINLFKNKVLVSKNKKDFPSLGNSLALIFQDKHHLIFI